MQNQSAHEKIAAFIDKKASGAIDENNFSLFEPYDVAKRPDWILDQAKRDGVDLYSDEMMFHVGADPHRFQTGFLLSPAPFRAMIAGSRNGKSQPYDAIVYGKYGKKSMGDIEVGDEVFGEDGKLYPVDAIFEQGERDIYEVEFEDGSKTRCDGEHLWKIYKPCTSSVKRWSRGRIEANPFYNKTTVMTLNEIVSRYGWFPKKMADGKTSGQRWSIPVAKKISWRKRRHIIPPYSFGALIGDGCLRSSAIQFTCDGKLQDLIKRIEKEIGFTSCNNRNPFRTPTWYVRNQNGILGRELDRLGLRYKKSEHKFIPQEYLYDSAANRLELLRGLMDTDGSAYGRSCNCEFSTKSKALALDVAWVVRSLGGKANIKERDTHYLKNNIRKDCGVGYRIAIVMRDNPFFDKAKACKWVCLTKHHHRHRIKKISPAGKSKCRCLLVDSEDHTYLTDDFLVTHNTCCDLVELAIMVSGEKPVSMRVEEGVKTGFKRKITKENIIRFGRFDIRSGAFIDNDFNAQCPEGWEEWDCGFVTGVGVYPDEKIPKPGETLWIGCTQRALVERWWTAFESEDDDFFPKEFIDRKRGYNGFMKSENVVFGVRRMRIAMISYESGFRKFEAAGKEAIGIHAVFFDEEPPEQDCVTAAVNRCRYFSISETPYLGITYTKALIFNPKKNKKKNQVFHATIYDSPYLDKETIDHRRSLMPPHEIGARIWGLHTELKGKPYFDRTKLNAWIRRFKVPYTLWRYRPFEEYDGMFSREGHDKPGLMSVEILRSEALDENEQDVWRVYEDRREGMAYFLMADSAEGSDVPIESGDVLASMIMRPPIGDEKFPQIVASLRSTLKTVNFARVCSYPLLYYNNALLCAEGPTRGSFNALFYAELSEYPFWVNMVSEKWSTRKFRTIKGFDITSAGRIAVFDAITEVLNEFDIDEKPEINDEPLLIEIAACVLSRKNGKLRPDHPTGGTSDSMMCYGEGLAVFKKHPEQIKCRVLRKEKESNFGRLMKIVSAGDKSPVYLGEGTVPLR